METTENNVESSRNAEDTERSIRRHARAVKLQTSWSIARVQARWRGYLARQRNRFRWPRPLVEDFSLPSLSPPLYSDSLTNIDWVKTNSKILIRCVTWNLCANNPPPQEFLTGIIPMNKFHIYVIGSEECERSIAQSAINTSKKNWETDLQIAVGSSYVPLRSHTLQAIHIIAYVHLSIVSLISEVTSAAVATGIGNTLGNKGAVSLSFKIGGTRFCFVNAHLEAHQNAWMARNTQFNRINVEMAPLLCKATQSKEVETLSHGIVADKAKSNGLDGQQPGENQPLDEYADRVVFMGDFNYRINGNRDIIDSMIRNNMHEALLSNDQLRISISKGLAFQRYLEPPLNFRPTYKLEIDSDEYDTSKKRRIPSWTDRVLYAPKGLECVAYNADFSIRTSDHRPVYASFVAAVDIPDAMGAGAKQIEYSAPSQVCSLM